MLATLPYTSFSQGLTPKISIVGKDTLLCFNNVQSNLIRKYLIRSVLQDSIITMQNNKISIFEQEVTNWRSANNILRKQIESYKDIDKARDLQIAELQKQISVYQKAYKRNRTGKILYKSVGALLLGALTYLIVTK